MKLREANVMAYSRGVAFVTRARGCGLEDVRVPVYTICYEARAFYELRRSSGLGLRDAASALGIRAIELSGLEHGCKPDIFAATYEPADS